MVAYIIQFTPISNSDNFLKQVSTSYMTVGFLWGENWKFTLNTQPAQRWYQIFTQRQQRFLSGSATIRSTVYRHFDQQWRH